MIVYAPESSAIRIDHAEKTSIRRLSHFSTRSDYGKIGIPDEMKIFMSRIAGAYPTEIAEGANLKDRNADEASSFGKVDSAVPGLSPMFNLSPKDTYAFLKTFAESDDLEKPFKEQMGNLITRLRALGIQIENERKPGDDSPGMGRIMTSLGYVAGMELAAEKSVRGNLDEQDEQSRKLLQKIVGAGSAAAGFAAPETLAGEILWEALLFQGESNVGDALDSVGSPRTDKLTKEDIEITLASHYELVRAYISGGYKMDVSPIEFSKNHPSIVDESGNLISFNALRMDRARLSSYREWLRANGLGGNHDRSFGQSSSDASNLFLGARQEADKNAGSWDRH